MVNTPPGGKKQQVGKPKVSYEKINLNECFFSHNRRRQVGKGSKMRQINSYMKQLGALRLLHHYQGDWLEAEMATGLYSDRKSWDRSEKEAAELMLRLSRY